MKIEARISKARTQLLLNYPWFGALAMNLRVEQTEAVQTFAVDGRSMFYNPIFADTLTDKEMVAVVAHEVMHCALLHMYRRDSRHPLGWNIATDFAINGELIQQGLKLPGKPCGVKDMMSGKPQEGIYLYDPQFDNLSSEVIFAKLAKQMEKMGKGLEGMGGIATGEVKDAPKDKGQGDGQGEKGGAQGSDPSDGKGQSRGMTEQDWKIAAEQAAKVAKMAGKLPASLERLIGKSRESKTDWRAELREFLEATTPNDYSWQSPNRRFIHMGVYLPGITKEGFGRLAVAVDTSGSIGEKELSAFASELSAICSDLKPEIVTVMYCDAKVQKTQDFMDGDEIILKPKGGGGTAFSPIFEKVAGWEEPPKALLYFTDLECFDTPEEPQYPVLWVTGMDVTREAPFGRLIKVQI